MHVQTCRGAGERESGWVPSSPPSLPCPTLRRAERTDGRGPAQRLSRPRESSRRSLVLLIMHYCVCMQRDAAARHVRARGEPAKVFLLFVDLSTARRSYSEARGLPQTRRVLKTPSRFSRDHWTLETGCCA